MQGDLISRKELIKELQENIKIGFYGEFTDGSDVSFTIKELERVINEQPTAYDVEKVVEKIRNAEFSSVAIPSAYEQRLITKNKNLVINIVRNGGKE